MCSAAYKLEALLHLPNMILVGMHVGSQSDDALAALSKG